MQQKRFFRSREMTECASPIIDEIRRLVMQYAADKTGPQIESPIDGLFFLRALRQHGNVHVFGV